MELIRIIRGRRGLSQRALAQRAGLSFRGVQLLESPDHDARVSSLEHVAEAFGLPPSGVRRALSAMSAPGSAGRIRPSMDRALRRAPDPQRDMAGGVVEVSIGGEQHQVVMEAEMREQGVDGPELDAVTPAGVAEIGGRDMVIAVRHDHRQRREVRHDSVTGLGAAEALEKLLKDEPGREHRVPGCKRLPQTIGFGSVARGVPPEGERPDAGVDEEAHPRERSAL